MDADLRRELNECISELQRLARELNDAAYEVTQSISGMNTSKYTNALYDSSNKYYNAADKLRKIN